MSAAPTEGPKENLDAVREKDALRELKASIEPQKDIAPAAPENAPETGVDDALSALDTRVLKTEEALREEAEVDGKLSNLEGRVPVVREALKAEEKKKSNAEKLHDDMEAAASTVTTGVGKAYEYVQTNVLKPMIESTKDVFLIGPLLGSLGELSPSQIKNSVARKWYQFLAGVGGMTGTTEKGFFGKMIAGITDSAERKLALLDVQDVIQEHRAENRAGETIVLNESLGTSEWKKMKEMIAKDPTVISTKVALVIDEQRQIGVQDIKIDWTDLLKTKEEVQQLAKQEQSEALKKTVIALPEWKEIGVTSVAFNAEETSITNGALSVAESELDVSGTPKSETRAAALLEARKTLKSPEKIVISKEPKDTVSINWNAPKTVTLPIKTETPMAQIEEIARQPQPDRFSIVEIGSSDTIAKDEVQLVSRSEGNVLLAENKADVLNAIAQGQPSVSTTEGSPKFKYAGGNLVYMPPPMSTNPTV